MATVGSKPVYAIIGADSYLQTERLAQVIGRLPNDLQRSDIDGEKASLVDVLDELRSFAMFGGGKLVVVRNADDFISKFREQLENYLASPSDGSTLILRVETLPANQRIYKLIQKVGAIEKCEPPKAAELPRWIIAHAKTAHDAIVSLPAAQLLTDLIGADLGRINSELSKLALQGIDGKVELADVQKGVSFQREQEMWDMTNEIASGNTEKAIKRWRHMVQLDPNSEFRAITWLGMWLEKVQLALLLKRQGKSNFDIAGALKIWQREMQEPFLRTAFKMGPAGVLNALNLLVDLDLRSKSGLGDASQNVERFLVTVGAGMK